MSEVTNTIGEFRFGLKSAEDLAEFTASLYREMETIRELGTIPKGTTYYDIADVILDTICNYAGMGEITASELPIIIRDALDQI